MASLKVFAIHLRSNPGDRVAFRLTAEGLEIPTRVRQRRAARRLFSRPATSTSGPFRERISFAEDTTISRRS